MKTYKEVIEDFANGVKEVTRASNVTNKNGEKLFSYDTCIAQKVDETTCILNKSKYTVTTKKHQNLVAELLNNETIIEVTDVPDDTRDLTQFCKDDKE